MGEAEENEARAEENGGDLDHGGEAADGFAQSEEMAEMRAPRPEAPMR